MYTADNIDTPYAFYVADSLNDDVLNGDNAVKAANEHLARKFETPELLAFRDNAICAFDARAIDRNEQTEQEYDQARREYCGMLASLRSHWDDSPEGRQSAMDVGL
jgi:hypothetical protein